MKNEVTGGLVLFSSTLIALYLANSQWSEAYFHFWHNHFSVSFGDFVISKTLHHWVNDGLMAVFFFVIGLELKREIIGGDLADPKAAILPISAAIGGMLVPALIYVAVNNGTPGVDGWGIPMATDIAFALGVLHLLGNRVPIALKVFLTALAIADDLGAVLVIALFYTSDISMLSLTVGAAFMIVLMGANALGVRNATFYGIVGIGGLWLAFLMSGVHATIAGVLAALTIPASTKIDEDNFLARIRMLSKKFDNADPNDNPLLTHDQLYTLEQIKKAAERAETPLQRLEHRMLPMVTFLVIPIFALANAGIQVSSDIAEQILHPIAIGTMLGLIMGKFLGIVGFSKIMVSTRLAELPTGVQWPHIYGAAFLASIGFTMSMFITELAFENPEFVLHAKLGVLAASLIGGIIGYLLLYFVPKKINH